MLDREGGSAAVLFGAWWHVEPSVRLAKARAGAWGWVCGPGGCGWAGSGGSGVAGDGERRRAMAAKREAGSDVGEGERVVFSLAGAGGPAVAAERWQGGGGGKGGEARGVAVVSQRTESVLSVLDAEVVALRHARKPAGRVTPANTQVGCRALGNEPQQLANTSAIQKPKYERTWVLGRPNTYHLTRPPASIPPRHPHALDHLQQSLTDPDCQPYDTRATPGNSAHATPIMPPPPLPLPPPTAFATAAALPPPLCRGWPNYTRQAGDLARVANPGKPSLPPSTHRSPHACPRPRQITPVPPGRCRPTDAPLPAPFTCRRRLLQAASRALGSARQPDRTSTVTPPSSGSPIPADNADPARVQNLESEERRTMEEAGSKVEGPGSWGGQGGSGMLGIEAKEEDARIRSTGIPHQFSKRPALNWCRIPVLPTQHPYARTEIGSPKMAMGEGDVYGTHSMSDLHLPPARSFLPSALVFPPSGAAAQQTHCAMHVGAVSQDLLLYRLAIVTPAPAELAHNNTYNKLLPILSVISPRQAVLFGI
ncbi:hypothetical protein BDV93DRAFT_516172 [Ceratobasidium sp. AG-I]|nr:hypothetical protein BDV93DRAFT_516172 [Ceratobasidium sp. AG-I]